MNPVELLIAGQFSEAAEALKSALASEPDRIGWVDGLAKCYCYLGDYEAALPLLQRVHAYQKAANRGSPGQQLQISVARWCLGDSAEAVAITRQLCVQLASSAINMAPDRAGGATFGLILHYMAARIQSYPDLEFAIECLAKLDNLYDSRPRFYDYPLHTVRQVLGKCSFDSVLEAATGGQTLEAARQKALTDRAMGVALGVALFHDGVLALLREDRASWQRRMVEASDLGRGTEVLRWQLARWEVSSPNRSA